jgi:hypothetical protein
MLIWIDEKLVPAGGGHRTNQDWLTQEK